VKSSVVCREINIVGPENQNKKKLTLIRNKKGLSLLITAASPKNRSRNPCKEANSNTHYTPVLHHLQGAFKPRFMGLKTLQMEEEKMNITPMEKRIQIVNALVEGCSVRSTARMVGVEHKTVLRTLLRAGTICARLLDERIQRIQARFVEVDEIWTYVFKKEQRLEDGDDPAERGDQYVFVGIESDTKLVISHCIGKRDGRTALTLIDDLRSRITSRVQLTTDGFRAYLLAVETVFGADVDYAQLVKVYGSTRGEGEGPAWYGPAEVIETTPTVITGQPIPSRISTSYIERSNLTMRMMMRRFTRLTNAFSKKLENLRAQVALHFAHYNFVRIHQTLRCTPAMEAGITDHVWGMEELLGCN